MDKKNFTTMSINNLIILFSKKTDTFFYYSSLLHSIIEHNYQ